MAALHQEQQETAWLRHKHALAKVKLEKVYNSALLKVQSSFNTIVYNS